MTKDPEPSDAPTGNIQTLLILKGLGQIMEWSKKFVITVSY